MGGRQLKERASIWKQERLYRQERRTGRGGYRGGDDDDSDDDEIHGVAGRVWSGVKSRSFLGTVHKVSTVSATFWRCGARRGPLLLGPKSISLGSHNASSNQQSEASFGSKALDSCGQRRGKIMRSTSVWRRAESCLWGCGDGQDPSRMISTNFCLSLGDNPFTVSMEKELPEHWLPLCVDEHVHTRWLPTRAWHEGFFVHTF